MKHNGGAKIRFIIRIGETAIMDVAKVGVMMPSGALAMAVESSRQRSEEMLVNLSTLSRERQTYIVLSKETPIYV